MSTRESLPVGGGLAGAVDTHHHDHGWFALVGHGLDGAIHLWLAGIDESRAQHGAGFLFAGHTVRGDATAEILHHGQRGLGAEVCHEQRVLDLLPGILIQVTGGENAEHSPTNDVLGLGHARTQLAHAPVNRGDVLRGICWGLWLGWGGFW